jgi:hypothetical protein
MRLKINIELKMDIVRAFFKNENGSSMTDVEIIEHYKNYEDIAELVCGSENMVINVVEIK